jgi:hypothetical protein
MFLTVMFSVVPLATCTTGQGICGVPLTAQGGRALPLKPSMLAIMVTSWTLVTPPEPPLYPERYHAVVADASIPRATRAATTALSFGVKEYH